MRRKLTRDEGNNGHRHARKAADVTHADVQAAVDAMHMMGRLNRAIRNVQSKMEEIVRLAAGSDDFTLMHWYVLVHLLQDTTCSQVELKSHTDIAPPHMTKLLDDLVARALVRRDPCPRDRRQLILTLTQAGRDACLNLLGSLDEVAPRQQFIKMKDFLQILDGAASVHRVTP